MNRRCLRLSRWPSIGVFLFILQINGCGDDSPNGPKNTPALDPDLSVSLQCDEGLLKLSVRNTGGPMHKASRFVATYADGHSDTLLLNLENDTLSSCLLSNIHGKVRITNEEYAITDSAGECCTDFFCGLIPPADLSNLVPSPLTQATVVLCDYTIYLDNLGAAQRTVELTKTNEGLALKCVYSNITGDLRAPSPGILCPDLTGNIAISSVTVTTNIEIGSGDNPTVTLGVTSSTTSGLAINVDGTFGFIVEWLAGWFQNSFNDALSNAIELAVSNRVGTDLSGLMIVNPGCGQ